MQLPLQISYKDFLPSDALSTLIREKAAKLEHFFDGIIGCRVTVGSAFRKHQQGNLYFVHIDLTVPGAEIAVGRKPRNGAHQNVQVALRDSFRAAERQLQDYVRSHRVRVHFKLREAPPRAKVARLVREAPSADAAYGFIRTQDGRELYFNSRSVLNGRFDDLQVGDEVRFAEEPGEEGPQASTVEKVA